MTLKHQSGGRHCERPAPPCQGTNAGARLLALRITQRTLVGAQAAPGPRPSTGAPWRITAKPRRPPVSTRIITLPYPHAGSASAATASPREQAGGCQVAVAILSTVRLRELGMVGPCHTQPCAPPMEANP